MSHSIVIIGDCINDMRGDATTGSLTNLYNVATNVDANLDFLDKPQQETAHELLESLQAFLCDGGEFNGASDTVVMFVDNLTPYMS